jgi:hypothetical protein
VATEGVGWWDFGTLLRGVSDSVVDLSVVCGPYCVAPWESDFLEVALGAGGDPGLPEAGLGDVVVEDLGFSIWDDSEEDEDSGNVKDMLEEIVTNAVKDGKRFGGGEHVDFGIPGFGYREVEQKFTAGFGDELQEVIDYFKCDDSLGVSKTELTKIVSAVYALDSEKRGQFFQDLADLKPSKFADQLIVGLCSDSTNLSFKSNSDLLKRYNHIQSGASLLLLRGLSKRFEGQLGELYGRIEKRFDFRDKYSVLDVSSIVYGDYVQKISEALNGLDGIGDLIFMQELWNATPTCDLKRVVFNMTAVTSLGRIHKYTGALKNAKCAITAISNYLLIKYMDAFDDKNLVHFPVSMQDLTSMSPVLILDERELELFKNYFMGFGQHGSSLIDAHAKLPMTYFKYQCLDVLNEISIDRLRHTVDDIFAHFESRIDGNIKKILTDAIQSEFSESHVSELKTFLEGCTDDDRNFFLTKLKDSGLRSLWEQLNDALSSATERLETVDIPRVESPVDVGRGGSSGYSASAGSRSLGDPEESRPVSAVSDASSKRKIELDTFGITLGLVQRYDSFQGFFEQPRGGDAEFSDERLGYIEKHFNDHQTEKDKLYFRELWDKRPGSPHWTSIRDKVCQYLGVDSDFLKDDASRKREMDTKEKNNVFLEALSAAVKTSTVDLSVNKTEVEFFNDSQLRALSEWFHSRVADRDVGKLLNLLEDKSLTYLEFQVAGAFDLLSEPGSSVATGGSKDETNSESSEGFTTTAGENSDLLESSEREGVSIRATRSRGRQPRQTSLDTRIANRSVPSGVAASRESKPRPRSLDSKITVSFIPLEAALSTELANFFTDPFDINVPGKHTMRFDKTGIDRSVVNGTIIENSEPHVTVGSEKYDTVIDVLAAHLGVENVDIKADIRFFVKIQGPYRKRLIRDNYIRIQETIQHSTSMTVEVTGDALVALLKDNGIPYDLESDGLNKLLLRVIRKSRNPGNFVYSTLAHCFFRTILVVSYNDGQPKLQKFTTANKCGNPPLVIYFDGIKYYLGNVHRYLDSMLERGALVASRNFSQLVDGVCDVVYVSNAINLGESDINYGRALNVFKDLFRNDCHMTVFVLAALNILSNVTRNQYREILGQLSSEYSSYVTRYFKSEGDYELPSEKKVKFLREIFTLLECQLAPATLKTINNVILNKPNLKYGFFLSNESDDTSTRESHSDTSTREPRPHHEPDEITLETQGVRRRQLKSKPN